MVKPPVPPQKYPNWKAHQGKHEIAYTADTDSRRKKRNDRRHTIWKKSYELATISGGNIFVMYTDDNEKTFIYSNSDELYHTYRTTGLRQGQGDARYDEESQCIVDPTLNLPAPTTEEECNISCVTEIAVIRLNTDGISMNTTPTIESAIWDTVPSSTSTPVITRITAVNTQPLPGQENQYTRLCATSSAQSEHHVSQVKRSLVEDFQPYSSVVLQQQQHLPLAQVEQTQLQEKQLCQQLLTVQEQLPMEAHVYSYQSFSSQLLDTNQPMFPPVTQPLLTTEQHPVSHGTQYQSLPNQQLSPLNIQQHLSPATHHLSVSTQQLSPPTQQLSASTLQPPVSRQQVSPLTQQVSPSTQQMSPSTQQLSQSTQQMSQSTLQLSQSTLQMAQSTQQLSPSTQQMSQSTQQMSQSTQQMSQSTLQLLPPTLQLSPPTLQPPVSRQQVSPSTQQVSQSTHQVPLSTLQLTPFTQQLSVATHQLSPATQQMSASKQQLLVSAEQLSPATQQCSVATQQLSPAPLQLSQSTQQLSPPAEHDFQAQQREPMCSLQNLSAHNEKQSRSPSKVKHSAGKTVKFFYAKENKRPIKRESVKVISPPSKRRTRNKGQRCSPYKRIISELTRSRKTKKKVPRL